MQIRTINMQIRTIIETVTEAAMAGTQVNLYQAKTQLSSLVDRAANGEEIVIAKAGKPMAKLIPMEAGAEGGEASPQIRTESVGHHAHGRRLRRAAA